MPHPAAVVAQEPSSTRHRTGRVVAAVALLAAACTGSGGGAGPASTATGGSTDTATAEVFADLDADGPGCAVAVGHPDGVHLDGFGLADIDAGPPIDDTTVFDIGSVSKQITAGAVALLVVRGDLHLDDDITSLVPELGPYPHVITVGDLLHHTSGLPDYVDLLEAGLDEVTTTGDALAVLTTGAGRPRVAPGEEFEYSNTNYLLSSVIVERVSGEPFPAFVRREIFEPLGMDDSVVRDDQGTLLDAQAVGYAEADDGSWTEVGSPWRQTGDGAVHATAENLLAWADVFVADSSVGDLGSDHWLEVMTEPGPVADGDGEYGGGLELSEDEDGDLRLAHGGSWIGYGSAIAMDPAEGLAVVVTCNIDGIDAESRAGEVLDLWGQ